MALVTIYAEAYIKVLKHITGSQGMSETY